MNSFYCVGFPAKGYMEMPGIEPGAFHMQSERATTALHALPNNYTTQINKDHVERISYRKLVCIKILV